MTLKKKTVSKTIKKRVCKKPVCKTIIKRRSAFRAISNTTQPIPAGDITFPQVQYGMQELDLGNEYNPATSTFIPKRSGVYSLFASVEFFPASVGIRLTLVLEIRVNNVPKIRDVEEFLTDRAAIDASGIVPLQAGDEVRVFAFVGGGSGSVQSGVGTRFEGARIS